MVKRLVAQYKEILYHFTNKKNQTIWRQAIFFLLFKIFIESGEFYQFVNEEFKTEEQ